MFFKTYHFKDYVQEQPLWKDAEYGVIVPYNLRKQKKKPHTWEEKKPYLDQNKNIKVLWPKLV